MKTLCPSCNTTNDAIGFNLTDKEIINMRILGLHEHLCKTCYLEKLSSLATETKIALVSLNEQQELARAAYTKAYESWKTQADLYRAIDYNINLVKFEEKKKATPIKKVNNTDKVDNPNKIEKLAKKIFEGLDIAAQEAIIRSFQANVGMNQ